MVGVASSFDAAGHAFCSMHLVVTAKQLIACARWGEKTKNEFGDVFQGAFTCNGCLLRQAYFGDKTPSQSCSAFAITALNEDQFGALAYNPQPVIWGLQLPPSFSPTLSGHA